MGTSSLQLIHITVYTSTGILISPKITYVNPRHQLRTQTCASNVLNDWNSLKTTARLIQDGTALSKLYHISKHSVC